MVKENKFLDNSMFIEQSRNLGQGQVQTNPNKTSEPILGGQVKYACSSPLFSFLFHDIYLKSFYI